MRRFLFYTLLIGCLVRLAEAASPRGAFLYENHCTSCHQSTVHIREKRKARSLDEIRGFIKRWADVLELGWREEDMDQVLEYLNASYYHY